MWAGVGTLGRVCTSPLPSFVLFGIEGGELHLNSIGHAVGPEMLVVGAAEAPGTQLSLGVGSK